jgi:hypothetical protein
MEFGKLKMNSTHLLMAVAAVVLLYALYNYSQGKSSLLSGMANEAKEKLPVRENVPQPSGEANGESSCAVKGSDFAPSQGLGHNSGPAEVSGIAGTQGEESSQSTNPQDLLPSDANSEWRLLNPTGNGDANNVNLLKAGYHIGRDTVLGSLRNANLQLRSEPANPQASVGPWNNTTIGPDNSRRPLEIGCGPM